MRLRGKEQSGVQEILSVTASWKSSLAVRGQGIAQVTESGSVYSPVLGKGFPDVTALLRQERASPGKFL